MQPSGVFDQVPGRSSFGEFAKATAGLTRVTYITAHPQGKA